jgi:integrase
MENEIELLNRILLKLDVIEKALDIVPDLETEIIDFDSSIIQYEVFAKNNLNLQQSTIDNQKSIILGFLNHSNGIINKQTVKEYLDSNDSESWKSNQIKALRRYLRDFLKLGRWMEEFDFSQSRARPKEIPSNEKLMEFLEILPLESGLVFLVLYNSGLRIGEVLSLRLSDIDFQTNMINVSYVHQGSTKSSWISFITSQTSKILRQHISQHKITDSLFSISDRMVQNHFKDASEEINIAITPHLLRTIFTEKCTHAKIPDKYINAFCGRISQSMIAKHYTDYSPNRLREEYNKVEPYLILN